MRFYGNGDVVFGCYIRERHVFSGEDAEGLIWLADTASKAALSSASVDSAQIDSGTGHGKDLRTKIS